MEDRFPAGGYCVAPPGWTTGFEEATATGAVPGWTPLETPSAWAWRGSGARTGTGCMTCASSPGEDHALVSRPVPVDAGDAVTFYFWCRCEGGASARLTATVQVLQGREWVDMKPGTTVKPPAPSWQYAGQTVFVVPGQRQVRLALRAHARKSAATWYVDDCTAQIASFRRYAACNRGRLRLPDVLLIGVDTLRQSSLACYRPDANYTPNIDRIAAEGRLYREVTTPCSWTRPSFASIFTSVYPSQHGAELMTTPLPETAVTLAELLREHGYFTAGFANSTPDGFVGSAMGSAQGFDVYFEQPSDAAVAGAVQRFIETNAVALAGLDGGGIFVFYHLFDPHAPYTNDCPAMLQNEGLLGTVDITAREHINPLHQGKLVFGQHYNEADVRYIRSVYAWDVAAADRLVGAILARCRWAGLYDTLNIVFCADHGESFGRNGVWGHGNGYESCVRTPLILRMPGRIPPGETDAETLAANLDIMPTVLDLAGVPVPDWCEGRSLLDGATAANAKSLAFCEDRQHGWLTVRDSRYKLVAKGVSKQVDPERDLTRWVLGGEGGVVEYALYDLETDPEEQQDIAAREPATFERLKAALRAHCERVGIGHGKNAESGDEAETRPISGQTRELLRNLGYLD